MSSPKIGLRQLIVLALLLNFIAQMIHEAGHWAVYQAYDRGPVWGFIGLVQIWDTIPLHPSEWVKTALPDGEQGWLRLTSPANSGLEEIISSAAGPLASLLGAVLGLILAGRSRDTALKYIGFGLSLVTSFTMILYYLRSPFRTGGDEFEIAYQLGIAKSVIEIPIAIAFLACLILGLRKLVSWKTRFTWLALILFSGVPVGLVLNYADTVVRAQINEGNPLFFPVIGVSLPVLVVYIMVFLGLWVWWINTRKSLSMPQKNLD